jgi:hypothetical protein
MRETDVRASLIISALVALFAGIGARASAAPDLALAWEPDRAAQQLLRAGGAYADVSAEPQGVGLIRAAIEIGAPPQLVWRVMTDCRETPKLITSADPCRVLSADPAGGWDVREQVTHGNLIVPTIRNVYRSDYQPFSVIRFHRVAGDMKVEEGEWRFEALQGGRATRVIYINRVLAPILAPSFLVRDGLRRDTPKVLMNLRHECVGR